MWIGLSLIHPPAIEDPPLCGNLQTYGFVWFRDHPSDRLSARAISGGLWAAVARQPGWSGVVNWSSEGSQGYDMLWFMIFGGCVSWFFPNHPVLMDDQFRTETHGGSGIPHFQKSEMGSEGAGNGVSHLMVDLKWSSCTDFTQMRV